MENIMFDSQIFIIYSKLKDKAELGIPNAINFSIWSVLTL